MKKEMFEEMLAVENSAAQETLAAAMVEWWMATDQQDALQKIRANSGKDLAGIQSSVLAGLTACAEILDCSLESLVLETDLKLLKKLTAGDVILILDAIHKQWVEDNFNARRWAEKFFKNQLVQYRKTAKLSWDEVRKDYLFIESYLKAAGNIFEEQELYVAFTEYATKNSADDDLETLEKAREFETEILGEIQKFREKSDGKVEVVARIDGFLKLTSEPSEIIDKMIEQAKNCS